MLRSLRILILVLAATACTTSRFAAIVPSDLALQIERKFGLHVQDVVSEHDLDQEDWRLFNLEPENKGRSPGFAELDCCEDSRPEIFLLIRDKKEKAFFLIAGRMGPDGSWLVEKLERVDGNAVPVIQVIPPGEYRPVGGDTKDNSIVILKKPAVALEGFESWEILYWWDGSAFRRAWLSD